MHSPGWPGGSRRRQPGCMHGAWRPRLMPDRHARFGIQAGQRLPRAKQARPAAQRARGCRRHPADGTISELQPQLERDPLKPPLKTRRIAAAATCRQARPAQAPQQPRLQSPPAPPRRQPRAPAPGQAPPTSAPPCPASRRPRPPPAPSSPPPRRAPAPPPPPPPASPAAPLQHLARTRTPAPLKPHLPAHAAAASA